MGQCGMKERSVKRSESKIGELPSAGGESDAWGLAAGHVSWQREFGYLRQPSAFKNYFLIRQDRTMWGNVG